MYIINSHTGYPHVIAKGKVFTKAVKQYLAKIGATIVLWSSHENEEPETVQLQN